MHSCVVKVEGFQMLQDKLFYEKSIYVFVHYRKKTYEKAPL